jgi:hypothetical protein
MSALGGRHGNRRVRPMVIQYGSFESRELRDGSYKIVPRWEREKAD